MFKKTLIAAALTGALVSTAQANIPEDVIQESFYPYAKAAPAANGVKPGMVIDQSNVDSVKDYLDPAMYTLYQER